MKEINFFSQICSHILTFFHKSAAAFWTSDFNTPMSLWNTDCLLTAGTFEKTVIFSLTGGFFLNTERFFQLCDRLQIFFVFRRPFVNLFRKNAVIGVNNERHRQQI